jgi:hypothetical protein
LLLLSSVFRREGKTLALDGLISGPQSALRVTFHQISITGQYLQGTSLFDPFHPSVGLLPAA